MEKLAQEIKDRHTSDFMGSLLDGCSKANTGIKQDQWIGWFSSAYKSNVYTMIY